MAPGALAATALGPGSARPCPAPAARSACSAPASTERGARAAAQRCLQPAAGHGVQAACAAAMASAINWGVLSEGPGRERRPGAGPNSADVMTAHGSGVALCSADPHAAGSGSSGRCTGLLTGKARWLWRLSDGLSAGSRGSLVCRSLLPRTGSGSMHRRLAAPPHTSGGQRAGLRRALLPHGGCRSASGSLPGQQ